MSMDFGSLKSSKLAKRRGWFGGPHYLTAHVRRYPGGFGWRGKAEYECVLARNHRGPLGTPAVHALLDICARNLGLSDSEKKGVDAAIHRLDAHRAGKGSLEVVKRFAERLDVRLVVDK